MGNDGDCREPSRSDPPPPKPPRPPLFLAVMQHFLVGCVVCIEDERKPSSGYIDGRCPRFHGFVSRGQHYTAKSNQATIK